MEGGEKERDKVEKETEGRPKHLSAITTNYGLNNTAIYIYVIQF